MDDPMFDPYERFRWAESMGADVDPLAMLDWRDPGAELSNPEHAVPLILGQRVLQIAAVRAHLEAEGTVTHDADLWLMWRMDELLSEFTRIAARHDRVCQHVCGDDCRIDAIAAAVLRLGRPDPR